jgi:hypothetical protein
VWKASAVQEAVVQSAANFAGALIFGGIMNTTRRGKCGKCVTLFYKKNVWMEKPQNEMCCAYCGKTGKTIKHYDSEEMHAKSRHFDFCCNNCAQKYNNFIAECEWDDLQQQYTTVHMDGGIPFCFTEFAFKSSMGLMCDYCGKYDWVDVAENTLMPKKYKHRTFCTTVGGKCIQAYLEYCAKIENNQEVDLHEKPHCLKGVIKGIPSHRREFYSDGDEEVEYENSKKLKNKLVWILKPGVCAMCGKASASRVEGWNNADVNTFCRNDNNCKNAYLAYFYSQRTNLTNGVPYIYYVNNGLNKQGVKKWAEPMIEKGIQLTCAQCGVTNESVIRNYGMHCKYRCRDFCMHTDCCKKYIEAYALEDFKGSGMGEIIVEYPSNESENVFCYMCGKKEGVQTSEAPRDWGRMNQFCSHGPCYNQYGEYKSSRYTNLTHGSPYVLSTNHFELHKHNFIRKVKTVEDGKQLTCAQCGRTSEDVVRNYGLPNKYEHRDFCKNKVCCKMYTSYADHKEYLETVKHLVKPLIL